MIGSVRRRLRLPRLALIVGAAAAALIVGELVFLAPQQSLVLATPRPVSPQAPAIPIARAPAIDGYAEITAQPLFIPSRRPEAADRSPSGPPAARPVVAVLGIAMTGGNRYALIRHGNPPKIDQVSEGQSIDGWQVQTIAADSVILSAGSQTAQFSLGGTARAPNVNQATPFHREGAGGD